VVDRDAYLDRIAYDGPTDPTPETLAGLTLAHLRAVPFENLDIGPLGRPLRLDPDGLYEKIVADRRGGFCFELNGLFGLLLEELGFAVTRVACRFVEAGEETDPFDHLALLVTPPGGETWFIDVGSGRTSPPAPLRMPEPGPGSDTIGEPGLPDPADGALTRIERRGTCGVVWRRLPNEAWGEYLRFDLAPRRLDDFAERCRFFETAPESGFRRGPICTRLTSEGRVSIRPGTLTITTDGVPVETPLPDDAAVRAALLTHFAIDLDRYSGSGSDGVVSDRWRVTH